MHTVTENALYKRAQRRLAHDWKFLGKDRSPNGHDRPRYYVVNERNHVCDGFRTTEDLAARAREIGVLAPHESVAL